MKVSSDPFRAILYSLGRDWERGCEAWSLGGNQMAFGAAYAVRNDLAVEGMAWGNFLDCPQVRHRVGVEHHIQAADKDLDSFLDCKPSSAVASCQDWLVLVVP